jgi:NAD(P) transhydrogenase subunit alpha
VRPAAKEQVASLGGKFIAVEDEEFKAAETAGGYAKEMSKEYQAKQAKLVAEHIAKQDIVITTALIPGRPAPRLVTREMLKSMKPGSVAVDLAVERGGNIEGAVGDRIAEVEGVRVIGYTNAAGRIAASASALYAKNLYTFLDALFDKESKTVKVDLADEIVKATALTHGGQTVHPNFKDAAEAASAATPVEATTPPADDKEVKTAAKGTEPGLDVTPKTKRSSTRTRKSAAKPADEGAAAPKKRTRTTTKKGDS